MKILLAEDDSQVRTELRELLVEQGYEVTTAVDGIDAFEKFRADEMIEILLLDIRMPRATGLQTLDAIQKIESPKERVFETLFITGNSDNNAIVSALKLGAFAFLFKPIVVEELLNELSEATDSINQNTTAIFKLPCLTPNSRVRHLLKLGARSKMAWAPLLKSPPLVLNTILQV